MANPAGAIRLDRLSSRIMVAADYSELGPAVAMAEKVGPEVFVMKVGSELAEAVGAPQAVSAIYGAGCGVFRDLKGFDIKNTNAKTVAAAVRPGVVMVNMHALNGKAKLADAHKRVEESAAKQEIPTPLLLAVTILTDNDWDDLKELGFFANMADFPSTFTEEEVEAAKKKMVRELVVHLAKLAQDAGLEGVICSPQEAALIRAACGPRFVIATPGIRPSDAPPDDQKRTLTPAEAIEAGADLLVIGRPITEAEKRGEDPMDVVKRFNADINEVLASKAKVFARPSQSVVIPTLRSAEEYLQVLRECGGYYNMPMKDGVACGPLVGYSGKYDAGGDEKKQFVGFRYFNLAKLEEYPNAEELFAAGLAEIVRGRLDRLDCIVGVPNGGTILGHNVARHLDVRFAGLEKKIVTPGTETSKEVIRLVFGRHEIEPGMVCALDEDLCNNFTTADLAIAAVEEADGIVAGIICGMNRSDITQFNGLPVVTLVHLPTAQYRQDDPAVAPFIENPGVVWNVKPNWPLLEKAMADAQAQGVSIV